MLYMVEMDFIQPARQAAWDAWYLEHLHVLLTVPGIHTAQRLLCALSHRAPYLAVYSVESPDVFEGEAYRARGGRDSTGDWKPTMVNWDRNLFAGLDRAPSVSAEESLLVTEDAEAVASHPQIPFAWLDAVGLDRTVDKRAIAVVAQQSAQRLTQAVGRIRAYRPLTHQYASADGRAACS